MEVAIRAGILWSGDESWGGDAQRVLCGVGEILKRTLSGGI